MNIIPTPSKYQLELPVARLTHIVHGIQAVWTFREVVWTTAMNERILNSLTKASVDNRASIHPVRGRM